MMKIYFYFKIRSEEGHRTDFITPAHKATSGANYAGSKKTSTSEKSNKTFIHIYAHTLALYLSFGFLFFSQRPCHQQLAFINAKLNKEEQNETLLATEKKAG